MASQGVQTRAADVDTSPETGTGSELGAAAEVELDRALQVFLAERTRLLRIAYRVVGDVAGAEDVVQDAWLRWQRVDRREINNPAAFLTTATTHLAINLIQSARHRHELPTEAPRLIVAPSEDPTNHAQRTIAIERMLGFLMAKLSPSELAAFVLRKSFDYPYLDIADLLGTSVANARQLARRSHTCIAGSSVRRVDARAHSRLVAAFTAAAELGEMDCLLTVLGEAARKTRRCPGSRPAMGKTGSHVTREAAVRSSSLTRRGHMPRTVTKGALDG